MSSTKTGVLIPSQKEEIDTGVPPGHVFYCNKGDPAGSWSVYHRFSIGVPDPPSFVDITFEADDEIYGELKTDDFRTYPISAKTCAYPTTEYYPARQTVRVSTFGLSLPILNLTFTGTVNSAGGPAYYSIYGGVGLCSCVEEKAEPEYWDKDERCIDNDKWEVRNESEKLGYTDWYSNQSNRLDRFVDQTHLLTKDGNRWDLSSYPTKPNDAPVIRIIRYHEHSKIPYYITKRYYSDGSRIPETVNEFLCESERTEWIPVEEDTVAMLDYNNLNNGGSKTIILPKWCPSFNECPLFEKGGESIYLTIGKFGCSCKDCSGCKEEPDPPPDPPYPPPAPPPSKDPREVEVLQGYTFDISKCSPESIPWNTSGYVKYIVTGYKTEVRKRMLYYPNTGRYTEVNDGKDPYVTTKNNNLEYIYGHIHATPHEFGFTYSVNIYDKYFNIKQTPKIGGGGGGGGNGDPPNPPPSPPWFPPYPPKDPPEKNGKNNNTPIPAPKYPIGGGGILHPGSPIGGNENPTFPITPVVSSLGFTVDIPSDLYPPTAGRIYEGIVSYKGQTDPSKWTYAKVNLFSTTKDGYYTLKTYLKDVDGVSCYFVQIKILENKDYTEDTPTRNFTIGYSFNNGTEDVYLYHNVYQGSSVGGVSWGGWEIGISNKMHTPLEGKRFLATILYNGEYDYNKWPEALRDGISITKNEYIVELVSKDLSDGTSTRDFIFTIPENSWAPREIITALNLPYYYQGNTSDLRFHNPYVTFYQEGVVSSSFPRIGPVAEDCPWEFYTDEKSHILEFDFYDVNSYEFNGIYVSSDENLTFNGKDLSIYGSYYEQDLSNYISYYKHNIKVLSPENNTGSSRTLSGILKFRYSHHTYEALYGIDFRVTQKVKNWNGGPLDPIPGWDPVPEDPVPGNPVPGIDFSKLKLFINSGWDPRFEGFDPLYSICPELSYYYGSFGVGNLWDCNRRYKNVSCNGGVVTVNAGGRNLRENVTFTYPDPDNDGAYIILDIPVMTKFLNVRPFIVLERYTGSSILSVTPTALIMPLDSSSVNKGDYVEWTNSPISITFNANETDSKLKGVISYKVYGFNEEEYDNWTVKENISGEEDITSSALLKAVKTGDAVHYGYYYINYTQNAKGTLDKEGYLILDPDEIVLNGKEESRYVNVNFNTESGDKANWKWVVNSTPDWVTALFSDGRLRINAEKNPSYEDRYGEIVIDLYYGDTLIDSGIINLKQKGTTQEETVPALFLGKEKVFFSHEGGREEVQLRTNALWKIENIPDWVVVEEVSGNALSSYITIMTEANEGEKRSAVLQFYISSDITSYDEPSVASKTLEIIQDGEPGEIVVPPPPGINTEFELSLNYSIFTNQGGEAELTLVRNNDEFDVTPIIRCSWCRIKGVISESEDGLTRVYRVEVDKNKSSFTRKVNILAYVDVFDSVMSGYGVISQVGGAKQRKVYGAIYQYNEALGKHVRMKMF